MTKLSSDPLPIIGIKIRCEWGYNLPIPWNSQCKIVIVRRCPIGVWNFSWATRYFEECVFAAWTARSLIEVHMVFLAQPHLEILNAHGPVKEKPDGN